MYLSAITVEESASSFSGLGADPAPAPAASSALTRPLATWTLGRDTRVTFSQNAEAYNAQKTNYAFVRAATAFEEHLRAGHGDLSAKQLLYVIDEALLQLKYAKESGKPEGIKLAQDIVGNVMIVQADLEAAGFVYQWWRPYVLPGVGVVALSALAYYLWKNRQ